MKKKHTLVGIVLFMSGRNTIHINFLQKSMSLGEDQEILGMIFF